MPDLTDEEYDALDEYYTENTIMPDTARLGFFARKYGTTPGLDSEVERVGAEYTPPAAAPGRLL
ncbi:MAG: hypothetical protein LBG73_04920 [Spirochaetaceae bacterium]|jgi:hypothetical protein|nr:hypothetical protein [Spirochaetaceae bacterium]